MKIWTVIVTSILIATLIFGMVFGAFYFIIDHHATYTRIARCQVVSVENDLVTVVDGDGEMWEFTTDRTIFEGEVVIVHFLTQGTETIYDDIIEYVKISK